MELDLDYACSPPASYLIETGNICNLRCPFCHTGVGTAGRPKGMLKLDRFVSLFNKIAPYAKQVGLYNWGEPFLNQDILAMVAMVAGKGISPYLSSHFSLHGLDHEAIVLSGLSALIVALDGTTQSSYEKYRRGGEMGLVLRNIKELQEAKRKLKRANPYLLWRFCVNKYNEHEQAEAEKVAAELGIDIVFEYMDVWNDDWESLAHKNKVRLPETMKHSEKKQYAEAKRSLPIPIDQIVLHPDLVSNVCDQVFKMMVINWDGDVYPCCRVYDKNAVLGNLFEEDLLELWNNDAYKRCREYLFNYGAGKETRSTCSTVECLLKRPAAIGGETR